jgi:hypothetical protein
LDPGAVPGASTILIHKFGGDIDSTGSSKEDYHCQGFYNLYQFIGKTVLINANDNFVNAANDNDFAVVAQAA